MPTTRRGSLNRAGALSESDFWALSIGPDRAPSRAELVRLESVYRQHPDAGYHGGPHCWAWWAFSSGLNEGGHVFTGELALSWLWLENAGLLTSQEAGWLAFGRRQRDEINERHPAATAAEYRRSANLDFDDYRADPLGEARRRRSKWLQQKET